MARTWREKFWELWASRSGVVLVVLILLCVAMLYISVKLTTTQPVWAQWLDKLATIGLGVIVVQIVVRYLVFKEAVDRMVEHFELRDAVRDAGFIRMEWFDGIDWERLFTSSKTVEMYFTSNTTWIDTHIDRITQFLVKPGNVLTVVLRDPDVGPLDALARRFDETEADRRGRIVRSANTLNRARPSGSDSDGQRLKLLRHSRDAVYSYYRFDDTAMLVPYKLRPGRGPGQVPVFFYHTSGTVYLPSVCPISWARTLGRYTVPSLSSLFSKTHGPRRPSR